MKFQNFIYQIARGQLQKYTHLYILPSLYILKKKTGLVTFENDCFRALIRDTI